MSLVCFIHAQIPDKTNDVIFLKMFLGHFRSFLPDGDFFQKSGSVSPNYYIWPHNITLSFRKANEPIPRKLADKRKGAHTLF